MTEPQISHKWTNFKHCFQQIYEIWSFYSDVINSGLPVVPYMDW
jgi:hypothetical protein